MTTTDRRVDHGLERDAPVAPPLLVDLRSVKQAVAQAAKPDTRPANIHFPALVKAERPLAARRKPFVG